MVRVNVRICRALAIGAMIDIIPMLKPKHPSGETFLVDAKPNGRIHGGEGLGP